MSWQPDERDAIQKRTFSQWINKYLSRRGKSAELVKDLFQDLRDGRNLITLLEMLSGQSLPRERGRMRVHQLQNIQIALNYIKLRKVKLVNIRPEDIVDGNQKLTLGLIWTIILHFQVSRQVWNNPYLSLSFAYANFPLFSCRQAAIIGHLLLRRFQPKGAALSLIPLLT